MENDKNLTCQISFMTITVFFCLLKSKTLNRVFGTYLHILPQILHYSPQNRREHRRWKAKQSLSVLQPFFLEVRAHPVFWGEIQPRGLLGVEPQVNTEQPKLGVAQASLFEKMTTLLTITTVVHYMTNNDINSNQPRATPSNLKQKPRKPRATPNKPRATPHHPFKLLPGGFQYYSGFSACLHSIWTSWTRIQLQKNLSCGAFWKKSKIDCFFSYFEVRIFRVVRRSF